MLCGKREQEVVRSGKVMSLSTLLSSSLFPPPVFFAFLFFCHPPFLFSIGQFHFHFQFSFRPSVTDSKYTTPNFTYRTYHCEDCTVMYIRQQIYSTMGSIQFNSIQFNSIQFNSTQLNSTQLNSTQLNSTQFAFK